MATQYRDLLPAYMSHQAWLDYADSLEALFKSEVEPTQAALKYLRTTYLGETTPLLGNQTEGTLTTLASKVDLREMVDDADYDTFDNVTQMKRLNLLGLPITDPTLVDSSSLSRLVQNIGNFWFRKGLGDVMDFIAYCLNAEIGIVPLWTQDYITFYEETSVAIGTPVWEGGTWYPTTHVRLIFDASRYPSVTIAALTSLFYDLANYVLILDNVTTESYATLAFITDQPPASYPSGSNMKAWPLRYVASGLMFETVHTIT